MTVFWSFNGGQGLQARFDHTPFGIAANSVQL